MSITSGNGSTDLTDHSKQETKSKFDSSGSYLTTTLLTTLEQALNKQEDITLPSDNSLTSSDYTIYTISHCVYCQLAKSLMTERGYSLHDIAIDIKPELGASIVAQTGQKTWPQIFKGDTFIGGYNEFKESLNKR